MFAVEPINRQTIDAWPIRKSGLPTRVVNGMREAGVDTVGQLRTRKDQELIAYRSIGRISVRDIHRFYTLCDRLEKGKLVFLTIQEVLELFLDQEQLDVLARRYGFLRPDRAASRNYMTLQEIGNELQLTRERIRQVQKSAMENLDSLLARECLKPFHLYYTAFIRSRGRAVDCEGLVDLEGQSWLAGYNPCSILILLHDLDRSRLTHINGFFSDAPRDDVKAIEQRVIRFLEQERKGDPAPLKGLVDTLQLATSGWTEAAIGRVLDHSSAVAAARDGRYFLYTLPDPFLVEVLGELESPVHYRAITQQFNQRLKPESRKGSGFVLKWLNASIGFRKIDRGYYGLAR